MKEKDIIKTYDPWDWEYSCLQTAAKFIENMSGVGVVVKNCCYDIDQDWLYTTLIADPENDFGSYQCTTPRQYKQLINGNFADFTAVVSEIAAGVKKMGTMCK